MGQCIDPLAHPLQIFRSSATNLRFKGHISSVVAGKRFRNLEGRDAIVRKWSQIQVDLGFGIGFSGLDLGKRVLTALGSRVY